MMEEKSSSYKSPKRIVKNTAYLYVRMLFLLLISLYTSRLVLKELGITDYGIYNVIGGLITIFSFINGSMAQASQRFITYELGKGDLESLRNVFSTCVYIHIGLAMLIVLLGETVGLWYIYNVATIPADRFIAALWIYQCSIIVSCATVITVPYNALIIAHERMSAFSYLAIIEAVLKLVIVFMLMVTPADRLITYGVLMALVAMLMRVFYGIYSNKSFPESRLRYKLDKKYIKSMGEYAGWSLWGSIAAAGYNQGLNLLINAFFNPAVNAARGISVTVQSVIRNFSGNFQVAVNPQLTKSYAVGDLVYMRKLIYQASAYSFFLFFLVALPVFLEVDTLLGLWLVEVPQHTANFIRILLLVSSVELLGSPLNVSAQATGKIRKYEVTTSVFLLLIVPLAYISLRISLKPENVFLVFFFQVSITHVVRILLLRQKINLSIRKYVSNVVFKILLVCSTSAVIPVFIHFSMPGGVPQLLCVGLSCVLMTPSMVFLLGLDKEKKQMVVEKVSKVMHKWRN